MRDFLEVFKYTFKENIRKKSFIVSTVIILVILIAGMVIPAVVANIKASDGNNAAAPGAAASNEPKSILYILDKSGNYSDKLNVFQEQFGEYDVKPLTEDRVDSVKSEIEKDGKNYLLIIENENDKPRIDYYTQQYSGGPDINAVRRILGDIYSTKLLQAENVPAETITKALGDLNVNVNALGKSMLGAYILGIVIGMILFFAIYFYGYGVSMSVASEKTSRVMELLVTSIKPSRIILGKTAGMGLLGLTQLAILMVVGIVTYILVFPRKLTIEGMPLEFSSFTPLSVVLIIIYFILGYTLYALMNAVVGATVSKAEDVQSAMMPMSFLSIISFYLSYSTFAIPASNFAAHETTMSRVITLVPFTSPFSVPSRLMTSNIPLWQIGLSLLILIASIFLIGTLSIRLYAFAVLHYGDRLKLGRLFEMSRTEKTNQ